MVRVPISLFHLLHCKTKREGWLNSSKPKRSHLLFHVLDNGLACGGGQAVRDPETFGHRGHDFKHLGLEPGEEVVTVAGDGVQLFPAPGDKFVNLKKNHKIFNFGII